MKMSFKIFHLFLISDHNFALFFHIRDNYDNCMKRTMTIMTMTLTRMLCDQVTLLPFTTQPFVLCWCGAEVYGLAKS